MAETVRILYFTEAGRELARSLQEKIQKRGRRCDSVPRPRELIGCEPASATREHGSGEEGPTDCEAASGRGEGLLRAWTKENFRTGRVLVYIGACGIAVRAIAPYVGSKTTDPAVLVIDERGRYVIPILSGHIGGANRWAKYIAALLGEPTQAVLTTATDVNGLPAIDEIAVRNGLQIDDMERAKAFSAALLREEEEPGRFRTRRKGESKERSENNNNSGPQDAETIRRRGILFAHLLVPPAYANWVRLCVRGISAGGESEEPGSAFIEGEIRGPLTECTEDQREGREEVRKAPICVISPGIRETQEPLCLIPRMLVLGIGCRRDKEPEVLQQFVRELLEGHRLRPEAVREVASIDLKSEEPAIRELAQALQVPFRTFSAQELREVPGSFSHSDFVQKTTGVGNVCERAVMAAGADSILISKTAQDGMTAAVGICRVRILL